MIRALLLWILTALPAMASEVIVAGLSQNRVSITADFNGSEILIYGAVKRDAPSPKTPPLNVIITVEGPSTPITVRKKDRVAGIWINDEAVQIGKAPSFYAVATTGPIAQILSETDNLRNKVTIPRAIRSVGISTMAKDAPGFVDALIRVREAEGKYRLDERTIALTEDTLFRTDVALPANLTEGSYRVRIFLTRGGAVVDEIERRINVRKEGLERLLFNMSREQPLIYGLLSLAIAVVAGYGASAAFRFLKT
jgi:uncharacterized protein (TIGR02186 family)